jgi:hypothetical protein
VFRCCEVERVLLGWRVTTRKIYNNIGDKRPLIKPKKRGVDGVEENPRRYRA